MKLKKLVLVLVGCFALASCATFNPKIEPTGYKLVSEIPIKDKNSSKIYLIHQYYEFPGFPIKARVYVDDKYIGRTFPELILLHETSKTKANVEIYGEWCSEEFKKYGSAKLTLELKPADEHYLVIREKYSAFEGPAIGGNLLSWGAFYIFCSNVENNKTSFHEIRKVSKDAWTEISKTKSIAAFGAYDYKDENLKAAREYFLKEENK